MPLRTERPTGVMPYPTTILAGAKGTGKTFQIAKASASPLVDRTFVLTLGEERPDAFLAVEGARFEMVVHDGTIQDIIEQVREVREVERRDDRPHLFALDSVTAIWNLLLEQGQTAANRRAQLQAQRQRAAAPTGNVKLEGQDWDALRRDWGTLLNLVRTMNGPSILTARLEEALVTTGGEMTTEKVWRMRADPNLGYEVTSVVEMSRRGEFTLTKHNDPLALFAGARSWPDFTMHAYWADMGLGHREFTTRTVESGHVDPSLREDATGRDWVAEMAGVTKSGAARLLIATARGANADSGTIAQLEAAAAALEQSPQTVTSE